MSLCYTTSKDIFASLFRVNWCIHERGPHGSPNVYQLDTGNLKVCALRPGGFTVQLGCPERMEASVGCPSVTSVLSLSFNDFTTSAEGQHSK